MDVLYHGISAVVLTKALTGDYVPLTALFSILPDLGTVPYFYKCIKNSSKKSLKLFIHDYLQINRSPTRFFGKFDRTTYLSTHSLLTLVPISILAYIFFNSIWMYLTLSYLLHLTIDAFTHDGEVSSHPLWPLFDWSINGKNVASHLFFFVALWIILFAVILLQSI